jgi:hypothetical protein
MKKMKRKNRRLGERLVSEFSELRDALRSRKPLGTRYTIKTVELDLQPKQFEAEEVRVI